MLSYKLILTYHNIIDLLSPQCYNKTKDKGGRNMAKDNIIKGFDKFIEGKNIKSDDDFDNIFDEFLKQ